MNMFNLHPGHTVHVDFCEYGGKDYIVLVDRMTGYIRAEQTSNQGTDSAINVVKKLGNIVRLSLSYNIRLWWGIQKEFHGEIEITQCQTQTQLV